MITKLNKFLNESDCNLSDDIILMKNDMNQYEEVKSAVDILQITGVLTDPDEISKLEEGITVDTSLALTNAKIGQTIWLTCLLDTKNHKTFNNQKMGVIQCRIQNIYLGLNKLNNIKKESCTFENQTFLKIYKNKQPAPYTHTVIKGDELYCINIKNTPVDTWNYKYYGKINSNYTVNGTLLRGEKLKGISIQLQNILKPIR